MRLNPPRHCFRPQTSRWLLLLRSPLSVEPYHQTSDPSSGPHSHTPLRSIPQHTASHLKIHSTMQQSSPQQPRPSSQQQQQQQTPGQPAQKQQLVLSSELIQSYLDQNQLFIAAIVENQAMGKLQAAMEYQIKLQQNLLFLASLADQSGGGHAAQPATPSNSNSGQGR